MRKNLFMALVLAMVLSVSAFAQDPNIPDLGVDIPSYINALATNLGTVIGAAVALTVAVVVVTMGVRWLRKAGK